MKNAIYVEKISSNPQKIIILPCSEGAIQDVVPSSINIIIFYIEKLMNTLYEFGLCHDEQLSLFGGSEANYQNEVDLLLDKQRIGLCSKIQNSIFEIEQFLDNFAYDSPLPTPLPVSEQNSTLRSPKLKIPEKTQEEPSRRKQKKIKKLPNSPFHNYQKHLNNALKKLIIVPEFQHNDDQLYKLAALEIWAAYCRTEIKTKRILHFIFNQNNEHKINDPQLKSYGLWTIYHTYGEEVVSQAKTFLSKLAIDQLDDQNIEGYLKTRKLRSKDGFKEYIVGFKTELEGGYLKRRITNDKPN